MKMVKRIAEILYDKLYIEGEGEQYYDDVARSVIAAMREASKEMIEAVSNDTSSKDAALSIYTVMLDAALK